MEYSAVQKAVLANLFFLQFTLLYGEIFKEI